MEAAEATIQHHQPLQVATEAQHLLTMEAAEATTQHHQPLQVATEAHHLLMKPHHMEAATTQRHHPLQVEIVEPPHMSQLHLHQCHHLQKVVVTTIPLQLIQVVAPQHQSS